MLQPATPEEPSGATGGIATPTAAASNFSRVGVPVASGYINMHSSGTTPNESKHIEYIVNWRLVGEDAVLYDNRDTLSALGVHVVNGVGCDGQLVDLRFHPCEVRPRERFPFSRRTECWR